MRFRKLRIAWSVVWSVLAALLIVLWVRSYWWQDSVSYRTSNFDGTVAVREGRAGYLWIKTDFPIRTSLGLSNRTSPVGEALKGKGPRFLWEKNSGVIWVPIWLFALVTVLTSAIPWFRWRFTLRTLLIATTLVAIVLGMIVWGAN
jgi:hypothetical protein